MKIRIMFLSLFIAMLCRDMSAEGSYVLNKNNKYRVFTVIRQSQSAEFEQFRGIFFYAKKGEQVLIGASIFNGPDNYDISVTSPDKKTAYLDIEQSGRGLIDTYKKEINGPYPDKKGYTPLVYTAQADGIYKLDFNPDMKSEIKFSLLSKNDVFPSGSIIRRGDGNKFMYCGIASWDITVIKSGGQEAEGRVFLYNLQCYMENGDIDIINLYMLSKDGYIYQISADSFRPFRFDFYCVNRGLIDEEGDTLYHSADYQNHAMEYAGIIKQHPMPEDKGLDITHYLFFNLPSEDLPDYMPRKAKDPPVPSGFRFSGTFENTIVEGGGGIFRFDSPVASAYRLIIDTSGPDNRPDGSYNYYDRIIENISVTGENKVYWDGRDKNGNYLVADKEQTIYNAAIMLKGAEFHFPLIDVENLNKGIKIKLLNPPFTPDDWHPSIVYYNDEDYALKGVKFNLGPVLVSSGSGTNMTKPAKPRSALTGVDSTKGAHAFGNNYGDNKIIDTWTFFPSKKAMTSFFVVQKKDEQKVREQRKKENIDELKKAKEGDIITFNDIMFYPDSSRIREESFKTLDDIAAVLLSRSGMIIQISGYTNSVGNPEGELKLSVERAAGVMQYFISKGIGSKRLKAKGYGALNLKESRVSDANRRVEIKVIGTDK